MSDGTDKANALDQKDKLDSNDKSDLEDKSYRILVDGTPHVVTTEEVSFDQVVNWAYPDGGRGPLITYTVTFYDGAGRPPEGTLTEGEKAKVKNGTAFNVTRTDRS